MKPITVHVQTSRPLPTRHIVPLDAEQLEAVIRAGYAAVTGKPLPEGRTHLWPNESSRYRHTADLDGKRPTVLTVAVDAEAAP